MPSVHDDDDDDDDEALAEVDSDEEDEKEGRPAVVGSSSSLSTTQRQQMELQAMFLIKSVEEIEASNLQLRNSSSSSRGGNKRQKIPPTAALDTSPSLSRRKSAADVVVWGDAAAPGLRWVAPQKEVQCTRTTENDFPRPPAAVVLRTADRALADDLSSCAGTSSSILMLEDSSSAQYYSGPTSTSMMMANHDPSDRRRIINTTTERQDDEAVSSSGLADRLQEIQSNADLKIRRLLHRVHHLEEQLALSQTDNERLVQRLQSSSSYAAAVENNKNQPGSSCGGENTKNVEPWEYDPNDDPTQQYVTKLLVRQKALIRENAKLKRDLLSSCAACRAARLDATPATTASSTTTTKQQQGAAASLASTTPPRGQRRPTFQSSARHVLENLPIAKATRHNNIMMAPTTTAAAATTTTESTHTGTTATSIIGQRRQSLPLQLVQQRRAWSTTPQSWKNGHTHHPYHHQS
jgi:hypothetical protein